MSDDNIIEAYLDNVRRKAQAYAKAKSDFSKLEHMRHVVLAREMKAAERAGHKSVASQDREARVSDGYLDCLDAIHAAQELAIGLEWELKTAEWQLELYRTQEATRRVEARHYGLG